MTTKSKRPKVLLWDIEASNLAANFGFCICIGYKWLDEKDVKLISLRDFPKTFKKDTTDDSEVVKKFAKVVEEADIMVTHYGQRFDFPYVQTRLLIHGQKPLPEVPHIDTWRIAKYKLKLNSNRLDTLSRVIPVEPGEKRQMKTPIEGNAWVRAAAGHVPSIKYIEDHCIADVKVLENTFLEVRPFASSLPNVAKFIDPKSEGCPACGSFDVQRRGTKITARGQQQRIQCQKCAHWFQVPLRASV